MIDDKPMTRGESVSIDPPGIAEIRERVANPDPDSVLDIEGLYDDASSDRAVLIAAYDAMRQNRDYWRESCEAARRKALKNRLKLNALTLRAFRNAVPREEN